MKNIFHYLKLLAVVVGAGVLSGLMVMWIALRDKGDITVPSIEGDEIVTALEKVTRAGLNLKITQLSNHPTAPRNAVISQKPSAGAGLKRGRDVRVVISRGPQDMEMPELRDMSLRQAGNILHAGGLAVPSVTKIHSDLAEDGVIAQAPPAGSRVAENARIELLVSKGPMPERILLDDFTGKRLDDAADKIVAAGLRLGRVRYVESGKSRTGRVLKQEPPPGSPVIRGQELSLVVARKRSEAATPRTYTVYSFSLPPGTKTGVVRVISENMDGEREVYNRMHKGGETLSLLVEVAGRTTMRVYLNDELVEVKRF